MKMKACFAVLKLSLAISLFLISAIWASNGATAKVCGCKDNSVWRCYTILSYCFTYCSTKYTVYSDMASCRKVAATPDKPVKQTTKQKPKTQPQ